jgi:AcrR family transcriptional regulator
MAKARKKKEPTDRRQLIVDAAARLFAKQGIVGTTFREIAKEAGVHQPLIGYYFPTFESLFMAVTEMILEDIRRQSIEAIEKAKVDPDKTLQDYIRAPLHWQKNRPEYRLLWTFFYHLCTYQPAFRELNNSIRKIGKERIMLLLYKYQEALHLRLKKTWTMEQLALAIQTQMTGASVHAVTEKSDFDEVAKLCHLTINSLLESAFES